MTRASVQYPNMNATERHDRLCNDYQLATQFQFWGKVYMKYDPPQTHITPYDLNSIMHYSSLYFRGSRQCTPQSWDSCPMMTAGGQFVYDKTQPSEMDLQAVRVLYPWRG